METQSVGGSCGAGQPSSQTSNGQSLLYGLQVSSWHEMQKLVGMRSLAVNVQDIMDQITLLVYSTTDDGAILLDNLSSVTYVTGS